MLDHGDDAGLCPNGLSAKNYREAPAEERAIYRTWILGMAVFYGTLLLAAGVISTAIDSSPDMTKLTKFSAGPAAASPGSN